MLERTPKNVATFGALVETHTILSHRSFEEVFDAAHGHDADGRTEGTFDKITMTLRRDFFLFEDRGFDPSRIPAWRAIPTRTSLWRSRPPSGWSTTSRSLSVHVLQETKSTAQAERLSRKWATEYGLGEADHLVESGDVESTIERVADEHSSLVLGATERGSFPRLLGGSTILGVTEEIE